MSRLPAKGDGEDKKALSKLPEYGSEDTDAGFENTTGADLTLPFLNLLQAMSPEVTGEPGKEGINGARAGKIHNTVTDEIYDSVEFIPSFHEHLFVEWIPRNAGGGFVGRYEMDDPIIEEAKRRSQKFGKYKTPNGNDLVETQYLYGIVIGTDGRMEPACIAFTSTKISTFKQFWTRLHMFRLPVGTGGVSARPPIYAHRIRIGSKSQTNKEGTFYNFTITMAVEDDIKASLLPPDDPRFRAAKELRKMVEGGLTKLDTGGSSAQAQAEEEIPF